MKKQFLSILLALCLVLTLLPGTAGAAEQSGGLLVDNSDLTWSFNDGTRLLVISGTGAWEPDSLKVYIIPWDTFRSKIGSIIIEEGATNILMGAFEACDNLTSVTIPNTVTYIGSGAFDGCSSLTQLNIPRSVTDLSEGNGAVYSDCENLTAINVEEGNSKYFSVDGVLFSKQEVNGVEEKTLLQYPIHHNAVNYSVPNDIHSIRQYAFENCNNLTSVIIPSGVTSIGDRAFSGCRNLTKITIPDSVTQIGSGSRYDGRVFDGCSALASVSLPAGITYIGANTFKNCSSLSAVYIPSGVTEIRNYAFDGCTQLKDIYYAGSEAQWKSIIKGENNAPLASATIHYNSTALAEPASSNYSFVPTVTGGTVILSKRNAEPGDWVNIYVTPDEGYQLESITVTDQRGWPVPLREMGGNAYSFTMPNARISVNPVFGKVDEPADEYSTTVPSTVPNMNGTSPSYVSAVINPSPMNYSDVNSDDWFYNDVRFCHERYIMNKTGEADGKFEPNTPATRAAIWVSLSRMAGRNTITQGDNWYDRAMIWAEGKGITDGGNPMGELTREQFVTMLWRYNGNKYILTDNLSQFNDASSVSPWAAEAVKWAAANGLLKGDNGNLNPQGSATRAEVAAILTRFCQNAG